MQEQGTIGQEKRGRKGAWTKSDTGDSRAQKDKPPTVEDNEKYLLLKK
jgi:hypothetical protein